MKSFLYKILSFLILPFFKASKTERVRIAVISYDDKILLVKNKLGNQNWTFPGGGMEKGESGEAAARRELKEELGIFCSENRFIYLKNIEIIESNNPFEIRLYVCKLFEKSDEIKLRKNFEILDFSWFEADNLPENINQFGLKF